MNHQELHDIYGALTKAKCPMDYFGEISDLTELEEKIATVNGVLSSIKQKGLDSTSQVELQTSVQLFDIFSNWAKETFIQGGYYKKIPYRVKLELTVKEIQGTKYFFVENTPGIEVFFLKLVTFYVESYNGGDKFRIFRGGDKIVEGTVSWSRDYTIFFNDDGTYVHDLEAKLQEDGDRVEMETIKFPSARSFALQRIASGKVIPSFEDCFRVEEGGPTPNDIRMALYHGDFESAQRVMKVKRFLIENT